MQRKPMQLARSKTFLIIKYLTIMSEQDIITLLANQNEKLMQIIEKFAEKEMHIEFNSHITNDNNPQANIDQPEIKDNSGDVQNGRNNTK